MRNANIKTAVIFAGGLGTRLKPFTDDCQKAMYPINSKPFLCYLINQIKSFGIEKVIILLGYKFETVINYFDSITIGASDGIYHTCYNDLNITFIVTPVDYDTNLRLKSAKDYIDSDFLMMYCDNICPIDFDELVNNFYKHNAVIELSVYENQDNWTKSNLKLSNDGSVIVYDKKRSALNLCGVDIGYAIVSKGIFDIMSDENINFEADVYCRLIAGLPINALKCFSSLFATVTKHRYYSIGSFEKIKWTEEFLSDRKFIFLDRDGTINARPRKAEYIKSPKDFVWLHNSKEAIKLLNDSGYTILLVTNQAGIGRSIMTIDDFDEVNRKMESDLKGIGAHIDRIYYCPHSWDEDCECRKPKTGMLYAAQKDYNLNLTKCILIGDDDRDIEMAINARVKYYKVDEANTLYDIVNRIIGESK